MTGAFAAAPVALVPVVLYLAAIVWLDGTKLVRRRDLAFVLLAGAVAALVALAIHRAVLGHTDVTVARYVRYVSPLIEEALKALVIVALLQRHRIGFLVDGAILGFAAGTGFALVENVWFLGSLDGVPFGLWIVRGFGTAIMHGTATVLFALAALQFSGEGGARRWRGYAAGIALAAALHSFYNHFLFSALLSTAAVALAAPLLVAVLFRHGEDALREWLGLGFDANAELLELIESGDFAGSPVGQYLQTLTRTFRGEVVADMLCCVRLHTELALRAKGELLAREHGFSTGYEKEIDERFEELGFLERSLGPAGRRALHPVLQQGSREIWQLKMLRGALPARRVSP
jgi:RsiW-degrading membrane proteinase PrsW (M82 family)